MSFYDMTDRPGTSFSSSLSSATPKQLQHRTLLEEEELAVVHYCNLLREHGMPVLRYDLRLRILDLVKRSSTRRRHRARVNMVKGPSDKWFRCFYDRHPTANPAYFVEDVNKSREFTKLEEMSQEMLDERSELFEEAIAGLDLDPAMDDDAMPALQPDSRSLTPTFKDEFSKYLCKRESSEPLDDEKRPRKRRRSQPALQSTTVKLNSVHHPELHYNLSVIMTLKITGTGKVVVDVRNGLLFKCAIENSSCLIRNTYRKRGSVFPSGVVTVKCAKVKEEDEDGGAGGGGKRKCSDMKESMTLKLGLHTNGTDCVTMTVKRGLISQTLVRPQKSVIERVLPGAVRTSSVLEIEWQRGFSGRSAGGRAGRAVAATTTVAQQPSHRRPSADSSSKASTSTQEQLSSNDVNEDDTTLRAARNASDATSDDSSDDVDDDSDDDDRYEGEDNDDDKDGITEAQAAFSRNGQTQINDAGTSAETTTNDVSQHANSSADTCLANADATDGSKPNTHHPKQHPRWDYTVDDRMNAMRAVKRRKMSFRQAERAYNVPASTLHYALKDPLIGKRGRTRLLGPEEEQAVVRYCEDLMRMGRPITKRQLKLNVVALAALSSRKGSPINLENGPGNKYFKYFSQRYPHIIITRNANDVDTSVHT